MIFTRPPILEVVRELGETETLGVMIYKKEGKLTVPEEARGYLSSILGEDYLNIMERSSYKGETGETFIFHRSEKPYKVIFTSVGSVEKQDKLLSMYESLRSAIGALISQVVDKDEEVRIIYTNPFNIDYCTALREALFAAGSASYVLEAFKTEPKRKLTSIKLVYMNGKCGNKGSILEEAKILVEGVYLARDFASAPSNKMTPEHVGKYAKELEGMLENVHVRVIGFEEAKKLGMGGLVSVGKGAEVKPRLVILEYKGGEEGPYAIVGKTLCFDSGGICIKPSHGMETMRHDKAGGAAALGAFYSAAKMKLPVHLYALLPAAMNMPDGGAYNPGDIVEMYDGTKVEIINTDAEGRMVLADAIAYARKDLKAKEILEYSTLTGSIVVALAHLYAGLFNWNKNGEEHLYKAMDVTGEKVWKMPTDDIYKKALKSDYADLKHVGDRWGGSITAAVFLQHFAKDTPYTHIDIAGTAIPMGGGEKYLPPYIPKAISPGYGVRLYYEYLKNRISRQ
ncbi:MAG: leucyl aminopeptidase family protein [Desulfurococcales archaeon]|nr:leucyl aminopeptidase family protein [Desulfurococcales archaeon]